MTVGTVVYGEVIWNYGDDRYLMVFWEDMDAYVRGSLYWVQDDGNVVHSQDDTPEWRRLTPKSEWHMFYHEPHRIHWLNTAADAYKKGDPIFIPSYGGKPCMGHVTLCNGSGDTLHFEYTVKTLNAIYPCSGAPLRVQKRGIVLYREAIRQVGGSYDTHD